MNPATFDPAVPANLTILNTEIEALKVAQATQVTAQTAAARALDCKASKRLGQAGVVLAILAIVLTAVFTFRVLSHKDVTAAEVVAQVDTTVIAQKAAKMVEVPAPTAIGDPKAVAEVEARLDQKIAALDRKVGEVKTQPEVAPPLATPVQRLESEPTVDELLGAPKSGYKSGGPKPLTVYSLKEVGDSKHGKILMPNVNDGRGIVVGKSSPLPSFEFVGCTLPAGYKAIRLDRTDNTGRNWVGFAK